MRRLEEVEDLRRRASPRRPRVAPPRVVVFVFAAAIVRRLVAVSVRGRRARGRASAWATPRRARRLRRTCTERTPAAASSERLGQGARHLPRGVLVARRPARSCRRGGREPSAASHLDRHRARGAGRTAAGGGTRARPAPRPRASSAVAIGAPVADQRLFLDPRRAARPTAMGSSPAPARRRAGAPPRRRRRTPRASAGRPPSSSPSVADAGLVERVLEVRRQVRRGTRRGWRARNDAS